MRIGVPKEIKTHEYRVGLTPGSVRELTSLGHQVMVEKDAGLGIGFSDEDYIRVGATIGNTAKDIFDFGELIIKVKEPQLKECALLKEDQILFTYLHLAPDPDQAKALMLSGASAIAYETVTDNFGGLPLLAPMSEVAGRMSIQVGASCLEKEKGGAGVLLGGVAGVQPAKVVVLGGGVVGSNAARIAVGMGAQVTIIDRSQRRLNELDWHFESRVRTIFPTLETLEHYVADADLVIGAVLVAGAAAPKLVTRAMVSKMRPGSVLVDVAIDQGGCFETSRATTHAEPTYVVDGIIHYCVANMPGAVPQTSAAALNNATLPYGLALANKGVAALESNTETGRGLLAGLNVHQGKVTSQAVAESLNLAFVAPETALAA